MMAEHKHPVSKGRCEGVDKPPAEDMPLTEDDVARFVHIAAREAQGQRIEVVVSHIAKRLTQTVGVRLSYLEQQALLQGRRASLSRR